VYLGHFLSCPSDRYCWLIFRQDKNVKNYKYITVDVLTYRPIQGYRTSTLIQIKSCRTVPLIKVACRYAPGVEQADHAFHVTLAGQLRDHLLAVKST
jgi:hypothetical protein